VFVDTTGWLQADDFTDELHPNARGSAKIATQLAVALQPFLDAQST
jgi:lysophospholipase L1-like esterase